LEALFIVAMGKDSATGKLVPNDFFVKVSCRYLLRIQCRYLLMIQCRLLLIINQVMTLVAVLLKF